MFSYIYSISIFVRLATTSLNSFLKVILNCIYNRFTICMFYNIKNLKLCIFCEMTKKENVKSIPIMTTYLKHNCITQIIAEKMMLMLNLKTLKFITNTCKYIFFRIYDIFQIFYFPNSRTSIFNFYIKK